MRRGRPRGARGRAALQRPPQPWCAWTPGPVLARGGRADRVQSRRRQRSRARGRPCKHRTCWRLRQPRAQHILTLAHPAALQGFHLRLMNTWQVMRSAVACQAERERRAGARAPRSGAQSRRRRRRCRAGAARRPTRPCRAAWPRKRPSLPWRRRGRARAGCRRPRSPRPVRARARAYWGAAAPRARAAACMQGRLQRAARLRGGQALQAAGHAAQAGAHGQRVPLALQAQQQRLPPARRIPVAASAGWAQGEQASAGRSGTPGGGVQAAYPCARHHAAYLARCRSSQPNHPAAARAAAAGVPGAAEAGDSRSSSCR